MTNTLKSFFGCLFYNRAYRVQPVLGLLLCIGMACLSAIAAPTYLDSGFGSGGRVRSGPLGSQTSGGLDAALQADGKIVVVGTATGLGFVVSRFNADGTFDLTFGGGSGWVSTIFGSTSYAVSVAIQADGKIVAGGVTRDQVVGGPPIQDFAIARYNPDGSLDTSFDTDGKATVSFNESIGPNYVDYLESVKIAPDGKIVVAGDSLDTGPFWGQYVVARLNTDGSLDTNFAANGRKINPRVWQFDLLNDLIVQPDGSVVVAGTSNGPVFGYHIVVKYNSAGGTEWTYSQSYQDGSGFDGLDGIAAQADGKFVAVGKRSGKVFAMRLNANGTVDNTFISSTIMPTGEAESVAIQADGKIVANFNTNYTGGANGKFSVVRYTPNGTLDTGFGGGIVQTTVVAGTAHRGTIIIQPDGKLLVAGSTDNAIAMVRYMGGSLVGPQPLFDFDRDGRSDVSVFRPSSGSWYLRRSTAGDFAMQFGLATDKIAPADYDGDGQTDIAVYRPSEGQWYLFYSSTLTFTNIAFGIAEDIPAPGDYDADGRADLAIFRPSNGNWWLKRLSGGATVTVFGQAGDVPASGDYDGDGHSDVAVFRPSTGVWYLNRSSAGNFAMAFGISSDKITPADYDGDGKTDIAVYRPSTGQWFIANSGSATYPVISFGASADIPVPADYDGDGKADVAIFRPSDGNWWLNRSTAGVTVIGFGQNGDKPTENAYGN